jgi:hypothetical protein
VATFRSWLVAGAAGWVDIGAGGDDPPAPTAVPHDRQNRSSASSCVPHAEQLGVTGVPQAGQKRVPGWSSREHEAQVTGRW